MQEQPCMTRRGFQGSVARAWPSKPNHMQDFFNCVRSRQKPKCNQDEAFIKSVTFLMSLEAYQQKREVRWDGGREQIL